MIVTCPKCSTEHPEFHTKCPKCNYSKNNAVIEKLTEHKVTNNGLTIFDLSFNYFATPLILKLLYSMIVGFGAISVVIGIITIINLPFLTQNEKIFSCFASVFIYILYVLVTRVACELSLVLFKIEKNTRK